MHQRLYASQTPGPDAEFDSLRVDPGTLPTGVILGTADLVDCTERGGTFEWHIWVEGQEYTSDSEGASADGKNIGHGYFEALGIEVIEGRDFEARESLMNVDVNAPLVAIVNQRFAGTHLGSGPVGRRFQIGSNDPGEPWFTVVGVLEQQVLPWLDYSLRMAVTRTDQKFSDPPDFRSPTSFTFSETDAQVLDFNGQVNVRPLPEVTITVGGEWSRQSADFSSDGAFSGFPFSSEFDEHTTDVAFFGQGELVLFEDRVILVGGGRVDNHSDFGTAVTGQFSGAVPIHETGTKIKGSWGTGFHAPDLADLFFPGFENPDLQPEEVESFEVGIEQVLWEDRFWLEVIYFDNDFTNLFQFNAATSRVENIAQASAKGVEISATILPLPGLRVSGSYSRVDTEDEETGQDLLRRPQDTVFGQVTYTFLERATASVSVLYVGERADQDFTTFPSRRVTLDPYTKVDLALSVLLLEDQGVLNKLQVKAKIDNLFDEDYEEVFGFPAPGLVYLFGVEATF